MDELGVHVGPGDSDVHRLEVGGCTRRGSHLGVAQGELPVVQIFPLHLGCFTIHAKVSRRSSPSLRDTKALLPEDPKRPRVSWQTTA